MAYLRISSAWVTAYGLLVAILAALCLLPATGKAACSTEIAETLSPIAIDGSVEQGWESAQPNLVSLNLYPGGETELSASWRTLWHRGSNTLYLLVEVVDTQLVRDSGGESYFDDCIEVYIDGDYSRTPGTGWSDSGYDGINDYQIRFLPFGSGESVVGFAAYPGGGPEMAYLLTQDGYRIEAAFDLSAVGIGEPVTDVTRFGFDLQVTDDDNGGGTEMKMGWCSPVDDCWYNPSSFGTLTFSGPAPTGPSINLTSNDSNAHWKAGQAGRIEWQSYGIDSLRIEVSWNDGASWNTLATGVAANLQFWDWNIPVNASGDCSIRLKAENDPSVVSVSESLFVIPQGMVFPNLQSNEGGTITLTPSKKAYYPGEKVTASAHRDSAFWFSGWHYPTSSTSPQIEVTLAEDTVIEAEFRKDRSDIGRWQYPPRRDQGNRPHRPHRTKMLAAVFSLTDAPIQMTMAEIQQHYSGIMQNYNDQSRGSEALEFVIIPEVLPLNMSAYQVRSQFSNGAQMATLLHNAIDVYISSGSNREQYDFRNYDGASFQLPKIWGDDNGLSNGNFIFSEAIHPNSFIVAHEMGHFFGLAHEGGWVPQGLQPDGPGMHLEYGGTPWRGCDMALPYKEFLGWVDPSEFISNPVDGVYRLRPHDYVHNSITLGLRVDLGPEHYLWVEVMRNTRGQVAEPSGVFIRESYGDPDVITYSAWLHTLDMHPEEPGSESLRLGERFTHRKSGLTFQVVAEGGEGADSWVDVQVRNSQRDLPVVPMTNTPVTIDGFKDRIWDSALKLPLGNLVTEDWEINLDDFSGTAHVLHTASEILLYVDIRDPDRQYQSSSPPEWDDSIAIFFDGDLSQGKGVNLLESAYDGKNDSRLSFRLPSEFSTTGNQQRAQIQNTTDFTLRDYTAGYVLEARLSLDALGVPADRTQPVKIGFDVMAYDGENQSVPLPWASRSQIRAWHSRTFLPYFSPADFGRILLFANTSYAPPNTLRTEIVGEGLVGIEPDRSLYTTGETVTATASAIPGYSLLRWEGDGIQSSRNPLTLTMEGAKTLRAVFAPDLNVYAHSAGVQIDGAVDAVWENVVAQPITKPLIGGMPTEENLSGSWKALWNPATSKLYLLIEVSDNRIMIDDGYMSHWDDSVEVFFDGDNSKGVSPGQGQSVYDGVNDFMFRFTPTGSGELRVAGPFEAGNQTFGTYELTAEGYRVEMVIDLAGCRAQINEGEITEIGLEIQINDDDDGGSREYKLAWHDALDEAWFNPSSFGTVPLTREAISGKTVMLMGYTTWMQTYSEVAPLDTRLEADSDGDGYPNLIEYLAEKGDPLVSNAHSLLTTESTPQEIIFTFPLRTGIDANLIDCEVSRNPANGAWSPASGIPEVTIERNPASIKATLPQSQSPLFFRFTLNR